MATRISAFLVLVAALAVCVCGCCTGQPKGATAAPAAAAAPAPAPAAPAPAPAPAPVAEQGAPAAPAAPAAAPEPAAPGELTVLQTWKIGGAGRWDLLTVDSRNRKVYIARTDRIEVVSADNGAITGTVAGVTGAHGVVVRPRQNLGFATAGRDNVIDVFDLTTLQITKKIPCGQRPDAILYDTATGKIFAFDAGTSDATVFKVSDLESTTTLPLGGKPEIGVADGRGKVYVNLEDKSAVVAIDSTAEKVLCTWPLAPGEEPTGLAYDRATNRLFAACANQKLIVLDAATGQVIADVAIGSGPDGCAFDSAVGVVVPCGRDGVITVVRETSPGKYEAVQTLETVKGARTIAADRRNHQFYLPCIVGEGDQAAFSLLVVGPAK